jgi:hypothetical protein
MAVSQTKNWRWYLPRRLGVISILCFIFGGGIISIFGGYNSSSVSANQYNNVQVFIETQSSGLGPFTLTAYNSSGSLISSEQSNYPAFSLELPSGSYLISVTAENQSTPKYYWASYSTAEYGYELVQISSSSTTLNLRTTPLQDIGTTKISIQAKYVNGTLASGTELDASIVGLMYWWPFPTTYASGSITLWNETDSSGIATLTVPSVPVIVNAWKSIYVNLPSNETTVVRNIGGENVNVTVFWEPMYIGLTGSTLIIPPATSDKITLHAETMPYFWYGGPVPLMGTATVVGADSSSATVANSPGMMPSSVYSQQEQMQASGYSGIPPTGSEQGSPNLGSIQPTEIPQITQQVDQSSFAQSATDFLVAFAAIGALIIAATSFVVLVLRGRRNHSIAS